MNNSLFLTISDNDNKTYNVLGPFEQVDSKIQEIQTLKQQGKNIDFVTNEITGDPIFEKEHLIRDFEAHTRYKLDANFTI